MAKTLEPSDLVKHGRCLFFCKVTWNLGKELSCEPCAALQLLQSSSVHVRAS